MNKNKYIICILLITVISFGSCKMDLVNPNSPSDAEILNTRQGMITLSVGMKQYYSSTALDALYVLTNAPTTREAKGIATFINTLEMETGGATLPSNNGNILALWSRMLRTMTMADDIIEKAPSVLAADDPIRPGILANAYLFKAMSIGGLATGFEQLPIQTVKTGSAAFVTRQEALQQAVKLLDDAAGLLASYTTPAELTSKVLGPKFVLLNCINAYRARYNMMAGKYAEAVAAANLVPLDVPSVFAYDGSRSVNPYFNQFTTSRSYLPRDNFGLPSGWVEATDARPAFYYTGAAITNGADVLRNYKGFGAANSAEIPVYLPDEMKLIKAEAILRSSSLGTTADAIAHINAVRTQSTGDIFGVNAALPAYSGATTTDALLLEVYKQRCMELYLSGLRLEDSRRFSRPAPPSIMTERNRNFYPYPDQERLNNNNTPADPAI